MAIPIAVYAGIAARHALPKILSKALPMVMPRIAQYFSRSGLTQLAGPQLTSAASKLFTPSNMYMAASGASLFMDHLRQQDVGHEQVRLREREQEREREARRRSESTPGLMSTLLVAGGSAAASYSLGDGYVKQAALSGLGAGLTYQMSSGKLLSTIGGGILGHGAASLFSEKGIDGRMGTLMTASGAVIGSQSLGLGNFSTLLTTATAAAAAKHFMPEKAENPLSKLSKMLEGRLAPSTLFSPQKVGNEPSSSVQEANLPAPQHEAPSGPESIQAALAKQEPTMPAPAVSTAELPAITDSIKHFRPT